MKCFAHSAQVWQVLYQIARRLRCGSLKFEVSTTSCTDMGGERRQIARGLRSTNLALRPVVDKWIHLYTKVNDNHI